MSTLSLVTSAQFKFDTVEDKSYLPVVRSFLKDVAPLYPCFDSWFNFKFKNALASGERELLISQWGNQVAGVSLLKNTYFEKKISTFYIAPQFSGYGVATELMERSLDRLSSEGSNVLITVSEERKEQLEPLLIRYFSEEKDELDLYRKGSREFFYLSK